MIAHPLVILEKPVVVLKRQGMIEKWENESYLSNDGERAVMAFDWALIHFFQGLS